MLYSIQWWDFKFSRRRVWRWLSSGMLSHHPDDGGSKDFWNVGQYLPVYTVQHPRRQPSSNDRMINELERKWFWPSEKYYPGNFLEGLRKPTIRLVRIACLRAEILTRKFTNTKQKYKLAYVASHYAVLSSLLSVPPYYAQIFCSASSSQAVKIVLFSTLQTNVHANRK
jgi:hypothetical protein